MNHRNILAVGFVILCSAVFVYSFKTANAVPKGPNISMGSNPIQSWAGRGSSGWKTLDTLTNDFIITDLLVSGTSSYCAVTVSTQNNNTTSNVLITGAFHNNQGSYHQGNSQFNGNLNSGVYVGSGSTLYVNIEYYQGECHYVISGYNTH